MNKVNLYLGDLKLQINPARIRFSVDGRSRIYDLVGLGEACILQGAKLATIEISGYFDGQTSRAVDYLQDCMQSKKAIRLIYTGEKWDVNLEVSVAKCVFEQLGGSSDVTFSVSLQKYVPINALRKKNGGIGAKGEQVGTAVKDSPPASYIVQEGDTLSHIARYALGDSGRWREIFDCNPFLKNPNLIFPGQELIMPGGQVSDVPKRTPNGNGNSNTVHVQPSDANGTNGDKLQQDLQSIINLAVR